MPAALPQDAIAAAIMRLSPEDGTFATELRVGGLRQTDLALADLTGATLDDWRRAVVGTLPDPDGKLGAANLMERAVWAASRPLAGLAVQGLWPVRIDPDRLGFARRMVPWHAGEQSGEAMLLDQVIDLDGLEISTAPDAAASFQETFEEALTPLVEELRQGTGLSRGALWRVAGDALAARFLAFGRAFDRLEDALSAAESILRRKGSRLYARQTDFIRVSLPENPDTFDWYRLRGGCCRYYAIPNGVYCPTCVLLPRNKQIERLQEGLRRRD
ncbi:MAG: (2Fe-2S)-binding protein [Pseudomonadota bacterium]